jgi:uncharacterized protein YraI
MSRPIALSSLLLTLVLAACSRPRPTFDAAQLALAAGGTLEAVGTQAAAAETLTATQLWPTATAIPPTATRTPTPTATATNTETPTATATPLPSGTVQEDGDVRSGPGTVYPVSAQVAAGETATPLGQTEGGDWYLIALAGGDEAWILAENFALSAETNTLAVITDVPPTPTAPPLPSSTPTPVPTVTSSPSPYSCDVSITQGDFRQYDIIVIGQGWPPDTAITLTYTGATYSFTNTQDFHSGAADSNNPGGFWHTMRGDKGTYTFTAPGCSRTVVYN